MNRDEVLIKAGTYYGSYLAYAFSFLRNWSAAEDVVQDSYIVFSKNWEKFTSQEDGGAMKAWGRGVIRNKCHEYVRAHKKESVLSIDYIENLNELIDSGIDSVFSKESRLHIEKQITLLKDCLSRLSPSARNLLHEYYVCGRRSIDIAKEKGQHPGSAKVQLGRLRKQLRKCMNSTSNDKALDGKNEMLLDSFFSKDYSEENNKSVLNLLRTDDGKKSFVSYILEYSVFASTLSKNTEYSETNSNSPPLELIDANIPFDTRSTDGVMVSFNPSNRFVPKKIAFYGSIAACFLLILTGTWMSSQKQQAIATIAAIQGAENVSETERAILLEKGSKLYSNDQIKMPAGVKYDLTFIGETTHFQLSEQAELTFLTRNQGRLVRMEKGVLQATIGRQANGAPFLIQTPHAEITVLGTRFQLEVHRSSSALFLLEGRLKVHERISGESKIITSGHNVIVEKGKSLSVNSIKSNSISIRADLPISSQMDITDHLIAQYQFDGDNQTIIDSSPFKAHGNLGTHLSLQPSVRTEGKWGKGVYFPNNNLENPKGLRAFSFPNFPKNKIQNELSIAFWMKHLSVKKDILNNWTNYTTFMSCRDADEGLGWFLALLYGNGNQRLFGLFVNTSTKEIKAKSIEGKKAQSRSFYPNPNTWSHIALTFRSGEVKFYVDGKIHGSNTLSETTMIPHTKPLGIGPYTGPAFYVLDEVYIFNRSIVADEVSLLYNTK